MPAFLHCRWLRNWVTCHRDDDRVIVSWRMVCSTRNAARGKRGNDSPEGSKRRRREQVRRRPGIRSSSCCVVACTWTWGGTESRSTRSGQKKTARSDTTLQRCHTQCVKKSAWRAERANKLTQGWRSRSSSRCSVGKEPDKSGSGEVRGSDQCPVSTGDAYKHSESVTWDVQLVQRMSLVVKTTCPSSNRVIDESPTCGKTTILVLGSTTAQEVMVLDVWQTQFPTNDTLHTFKVEVRRNKTWQSLCARGSCWVGLRPRVPSTAEPAHITASLFPCQLCFDDDVHRHIGLSSPVQNGTRRVPARDNASPAGKVGPNPMRNSLCALLDCTRCRGAERKWFSPA